MKTLSNKTKLNSILLYIEGLNLYYWRVSISCPKIFLYILNGISLDCHTCLNQANWVDISNNIFWFIIENNYFIFINYYFYIIFTFIFEKKNHQRPLPHVQIPFPMKNNMRIKNLSPIKILPVQLSENRWAFVYSTLSFLSSIQVFSPSTDYFNIYGHYFLWLCKIHLWF